MSALRALAALLCLTALAAGAGDLTFDSIFGLAWGEQLAGKPGLSALYVVRGSDTAFVMDEPPATFLGAPLDSVTLWGCSDRLVGASIVLADPPALPAMSRKLVELLGVPSPQARDEDAMIKDGLRVKVNQDSNSVYIAHDPSRDKFCPPPLPVDPLRKPIR